MLINAIINYHRIRDLLTNMNNLKENFDSHKKIPLSRPLFSKKRSKIVESNIIHTINNNKKRVLSEYDLSGLNNKLLLTETNSKKDLFPFLSSTEEIEFYKEKSKEREYLKEQLNKLQVPEAIMQGVYQGIGNTLQKIESDIVNHQLQLAPEPKSINDLITRSTRKNNNINTSNNTQNNTECNSNDMTQKAIRNIKELKGKENKIKKSIYKLDHYQKELEKESYLNISNSIIESNIRNDQLREIKVKKDALYDKLEETNQRVAKIIEENKPLNRNENIKQFIENFDFDKDDFPSKREQYEKQSMQLKEKRLNDVAMVQEKKKKDLEQMEKESLEQRERYLTELHEKETAIVKKRKQEMDSQMEKTKQYINEKSTKTEKDYLYHLNKDKYEFEQKKLFDKIKQQKKDDLITKEEYLELANKSKQNKIQLNQENIEKRSLMKEMWKNRSQLLPSFKSNISNIIEKEKAKEKEEEEMMIKKKIQQIQDGVSFDKHKPKPNISKALKKERENRIFRMKNKRNVKRKRYQQKKMSIEIPQIHKKTKSQLPQFTKPLKQLEVLPNYLDSLKKKREQSTSPIPPRDWEKEINDNRGTAIENVELLKIQTEVIDKKVEQKKQFMKANGGYAQQSEIGDTIGELLIDSIKAKLMIINKLKGKSHQK